MPDLKYDALLRSLKKGDIRPTYYFHGDQELLKDDALRDLLDAALDLPTRDFNLDRRRAADTSAEDFESLTMTPPMMAARRAVVLSEVESLQQRRPRAQALRAALVAYLGRPSPETVLVLLQSSGEKLDPSIAKLATAVAFDALPPDRVGRWIRHRAGKDGLTLDDEAIEHLLATVGDDLAQLAAEMAKLRAAVGERPATMADVADLVGVRHGETIHDFVDAVGARRFTDAVAMIPFLLDGPGITGVKLVTALAVALTGVSLARAFLDERLKAADAKDAVERAMNVARPGNLRRWPDEAARWTRDAESWSAEELDAALERLLAADRRLKNPSLGGDQEIVTDAVLAMAGAGSPA